MNSESRHPPHPHWWTETGQGDFGLYFIRDKQKREVDFVERDCLEINKPVTVRAKTLLAQLV